METFEMVLEFLKVVKSYNEDEYCKLIVYSDHSGFICYEATSGTVHKLFSFGESFAGAFDGFVRWLIGEAKKENVK